MRQSMRQFWSAVIFFFLALGKSSGRTCMHFDYTSASFVCGLSIQLLSVVYTWIIINSSHCHYVFNTLDQFFVMRRLGATATGSIRNWALSCLVDIQLLPMLKFYNWPVICCRNCISHSTAWNWGILVLPAALYSACIWTSRRRAYC